MPLAEKYSGGPTGYDQSIPKGVFNLFLGDKASHLLYIFSKAYDVFLMVDPVFH